MTRLLSFARDAREARDDRQFAAQSSTELSSASQMPAQFDHQLLDRLLVTEDELIARGIVQPFAPERFIPRAEFDRRLFAELDAIEVEIERLTNRKVVLHVAA